MQNSASEYGRTRISLCSLLLVDFKSFYSEFSKESVAMSNQDKVTLELHDKLAKERLEMNENTAALVIVVNHFFARLEDQIKDTTSKITDPFSSHCVA